jgi:nodulation protein E
MTNRVVITGLGVISALGPNRDSFWKRLQNGEHAFAPIEAVHAAALRYPMVAEVKNFKPEDSFSFKEIEWMDRVTQFAVVAAREAVRDAGIDSSADGKARFAVVLGTSMGGQTTEDAGFRDLYENKKRVPPLSIPRIMANAGASHVCIDLGITGPAYTISTACASANHALGQAFWLIRSGLVDAAVTGGSEAPLSYGNLKAWESLRVISQDLCRPFSKDRNGIILGEGAGILVLESLERAKSRGARVYAEVIGFGMSADAAHMIQPSIEGAARAMEAALEDGKIARDEVDYINAHGTGTTSNDATEAAAIRQIFGETSRRIPVSSTKSMHGHTLGAAGGLEGVALSLTIANDILPPTANFTAADPECDLDVVPNTARPARVRVALSNSFAFGGLNAVVAFRRYDGQ